MMTKRIKLVYLSFFGSLVSLLIHNLLYGVTKVEEWFFLGVTFLFIIAFVVILFYSVMEFVIDKEPVDLWKVGFLGIFGLIGMIPGFSIGFGFFVFFVLFGTRNYY